MGFLKGFTILALLVGFAGGCNSEAPTACNPALDPNACVAAPQCSGSMRDCKNGGLDGCETDVSQDTNNCGACGNRCPNVASGHSTCENGVCGAAPCGTRYKDCNGDPSDGCETDSLRSVDNCGTCGTKCSSGTNAGATCSAGQCQLACQAGYLDCNSDPSDGCETNGAQDTNNCGTCGNKCVASGASNAVCASGSCSLSSCTAPYLTCKSGATTSCEVNSNNDLNNCGSCNHVCDPVPNGTPACVASNCAVGGCDQDFADCDGVISNGCEEFTVFNPLHCGSCAACPGVGLTTSDVDCVNRTCTYTCRGEQYDVNGNGADGCEFADSGSPGHLKRNASGNRGSKDCDDARSSDAFSGVIASDGRVHTNPMVSNFNSATGATPDWWWVTATGAFGCVNDYAITVSTTGGGSTACYNFIYYINGVAVDLATLTGKDSRTFSGGIGSYSDGNIFDFFIEKTCSTQVTETVTYTIGYHL